MKTISCATIQNVVNDDYDRALVAKSRTSGRPPLPRRPKDGEIYSSVQLEIDYQSAAGDHPAASRGEIIKHPGAGWCVVVAASRSWRAGSRDLGFRHYQALLLAPVFRPADLNVIANFEARQAEDVRARQDRAHRS